MSFAGDGYSHNAYLTSYAGNLYLGQGTNGSGQKAYLVSNGTYLASSTWNFASYYGGGRANQSITFTNGYAFEVDAVQGGTGPSYAIVKYNFVGQTYVAAKTTASMATTIASDNNYVYYSLGTTIRRCNIDFSSDVAFNNTYGTPKQMSIDTTTNILYSADSGGVRTFNTVSLNGINSNFTGAAVAYTGIAVSPGVVFCANSAGVKAYSTANGSLLGTVSTANTLNITLYGDYLFALQSNKYIYRYSVASYLSTSPPSITYANVQSNGSAIVSFTQSGSVNGYYYSSNGGASFTTAQQTTSPVVIPGLNINSSYSLSLIAYGATGNSTASSISVGSSPVITGITFLQTSIVVNFTPSSGATATNYLYSLDGGATFGNSTSTLTSPLTISNLTSGQTYYVSMIASGTNWRSANSTVYVASHYPCFKEGSKILAFIKGREQYVPVETLQKGDLIKTSTSGYKAIRVIGTKMIDNRPDADHKNILYRYTCGTCPELFEDLCITGEHCALVNVLSDEKLEEIKYHMGKIYTTEGDYRVPAHLDERARPYTKSGSVAIWHFALDHTDIYENYGVFANGLLVESSSIRYMSELSNMELV